jgi:hypothetical protein
MSALHAHHRRQSVIHLSDSQGDKQQGINSENVR